MGLQELWFILLAALFLGFFVLEGFDFGVGMLMAFSAGPLRAARAPTPNSTAGPHSTPSARCGTATRSG